MRCGYPASSIRERIYADAETERFGVLLYRAPRNDRIVIASEAKQSPWSHEIDTDAITPKGPPVRMAR